MGLGIKKEDTILVIEGKEKGKRGRVIAALPQKDTLLVEQINVVKKHMKPNKQYQQGGIIEREMPLQRSKVMLVCPKCDQPTRIGNMVFEDGRKLRACKKCGEVMDK